MDLGVGEVGQAAGVVGVEVGGDDAAHVGGGEAERLDLLERRLSIVGLRARISLKAGAEPAEVAGVLDAEAGVDQDQAVVGLDQQAVADGRRPRSSKPPSPSSSRRPCGHIDPQLR